MFYPPIYCDNAVFDKADNFGGKLRDEYLIVNWFAIEVEQEFWTKKFQTINSKLQRNCIFWLIS